VSLCIFVTIYLLLLSDILKNFIFYCNIKVRFAPYIRWLLRLSQTQAKAALNLGNLSDRKPLFGEEGAS